MTRDQLEHLIRAAAAISGEDEIVIVGSQSILGKFPDAPSVLRVSVEADLFPREHPEKSDLIDGSIGEGSFFHETFGYYAQGVDENTSTLPAGWKSRLIPINSPATRGATGWALDPHDLMIAKYVAGREKDRVFTSEAAKHRLLDERVLRERFKETTLAPDVAAAVEERIRRDFPG